MCIYIYIVLCIYIYYIIDHFHTISTYDVIFTWNNVFFFNSMSHGADHLKLDILLLPLLCLCFTHPQTKPAQ